MAYYKKVDTTVSSDQMIQNLVGTAGCCDESVTEQTWSHTAKDLTSDTVTGINIDGTLYTFTTGADTEALLRAGINEAFLAAGYLDIRNAGVTVSGGDDAAVAVIKTTATLTVLDATSDVTLSVS